MKRRTHLDVKHEIHGRFNDGRLEIHIRMLLLDFLSPRFKFSDRLLASLFLWLSVHFCEIWGCFVCK